MNRLIAWFGGYFWLPCSQCGTKFGGHQRGWRPSNSHGQQLLCRRCNR